MTLVPLGRLRFCSPAFNRPWDLGTFRSLYCVSADVIFSARLDAAPFVPLASLTGNQLRRKFPAQQACPNGEAGAH
jgi:hypothetical protein